MVLPGVNFFVPSSQCGVVFCICDENSVDNTEMFSLLFSRAHTEAFSAPARLFLLLTPLVKRLGRDKEWGKTQLGQLTPEMFQTVWHCAQHTKLGGKKKERKFGVIMFVFPSQHYV